MSTYTVTIFARVDLQGTAAAETAVCADHIPQSPVLPGDADGPLLECTGNDALSCAVCGINNAGDYGDES